MMHEHISLVSVNLLRAKVSVLSRAKRVRRSNSLAIDIGDTKPSKLLTLDNSDDRKGGSRLSDISPRNLELGAVSAGLLRPALGSSIGAGHADDGASIGPAVSLDGEVVVAAVVVLAAVSGHILDGPCLAVDGLGAGEGTSVRNGSSGRSSRSISGRDDGVGEVGRRARPGVGRVAASGNAGDRSKSLLGSHSLGGEVGVGAGSGMSGIATTRDTSDRGEGLFDDNRSGSRNIVVDEIRRRAGFRVGRVATTGDLSRGWLGERCGSAGTVLAVASVILAHACSQGAGASNLEGAGCNAGLVGILAFVPASKRGGGSGRGQGKSKDKGVHHGEGCLW